MCHPLSTYLITHPLLCFVSINPFPLQIDCRLIGDRVGVHTQASTGLGRTTIAMPYDAVILISSAGAGPGGIGANAGPRRLSCCSWLLLLSLSVLLLLRGSSLLPGPSLLLSADTRVLQADARWMNASLIRGVNPLEENGTTSAALGSGRAAGTPPHAIEGRVAGTPPHAIEGRVRVFG